MYFGLLSDSQKTASQCGMKPGLPAYILPWGSHWHSVNSPSFLPPEKKNSSEHDLNT